MKKILKKFLGIIFSVAIISNSVYAKSIYINNEEQLNIVEENEIYYMKDVELFDNLGITYKFDEGTQTGNAKFDNNILILNRGSNIALLNNEEITLENIPLKGDNDSYNTYLMLPVLEICELIGANIVPYTNQNMITIDYLVNNNLSKENINLNEDTLYYTYNEALQLAINNSTEIKDYMEEKDSLQFELEKLTNDYTISSNSQYSAYVKYKMSQMNIQNSLNMYDQTMNKYENSIEYNLIQLLCNITLQEEKILQQQQTILVNEMKYNNSSFKYEKGDISYSELMTNENNYKNSVTDLQYNETQLNSYKEQLNLLLGLKLEDDVEVQYNFDTEPLTLNIDSYARGNAINDISVKNLSSDLEVLRYELDNYYADGGLYYYEEKDELQSNINSKSRQYTDMIDKKESDIKSKYTSLLELQSKYETLQSDYDEALFNYNNILFKYNIGDVTKLEVEQSYQNLMTVKFNILNNSFSQVQTKFLLQNPQLI